MSFYHNLFAREHNLFVEAFRTQAAEMPEADSGLRNPARPDAVIRNKEVTDEELFERRGWSSRRRSPRSTRSNGPRSSSMMSRSSSE